MNRSYWPPVLGALLLAACTGGPTTPDGAVLLDEEITLVRGASVDSARREFEVQGGSVVVALVDEQLTDIKLQLAILDSGGKTPGPVEVENNLRGAGMEVAAVTVLRGSRIRVTLTGQHDANTARACALAPPSFRCERQAIEVRSVARGIQGVVWGDQRKLPC